MASFGELTKQVHLLNDLILTDMVCSKYRYFGASIHSNASYTSSSILVFLD